MNEKGQKEITTLEEAKAFCKRHKIRLLLSDPTAKREDIIGSFPIVNIRKTGTGKVQLVRKGDGDEILDEALGVEIERENAIPSHHTSHDYGSLKQFLKEKQLPPKTAREVTLRYKGGKKLEEIKNELETMQRNDEQGRDVTPLD